MASAYVHEIFASIQGEGPWVGTRHIFVRFYGCSLGCRYCDTTAAIDRENASGSPPHCSVQTSIVRDERELVQNPIFSSRLTELCSRLVVQGPSRPTLSLTGGEPLLHDAFLKEWLPQVKKDFTTYLETNGIHPDRMEGLRDLIDIVSMDIKLPSATGLKPYWDEHRQFLRTVRDLKVFVKIVVTKDTEEEDIAAAAGIVADHDTTAPLIIQPANGTLAPGPGTVLRFQQTALRMLQDVRVIPQVHKMLQIP